MLYNLMSGEMKKKKSVYQYRAFVSFVFGVVCLFVCLVFGLDFGF